VPIVEPEILLDGDHAIERTFEVAEKVWAEVFFYLSQNNVLLEGALLKPSMVTPGADHKTKASPETIAKSTLKMLRRNVPPAVPGIMVCFCLWKYFIVRYGKKAFSSLLLDIHDPYLGYCPGEKRQILFSINT
jgi:Fructose-bisphosphate aldolase class-I